MKQKNSFDFWYAVNNTEIIQLPMRHLETFGTTVLHYHLVTELMDAVDQVRIREGRMKASRPQIITPEAYASTFMEGFGEEARRYIDWLREHEKDVHILQYGYRLSQESFSEHLVTDNLKAVVERVKNDVKARNDPFSAVLVGVDDPWDVCLVKLFWEVIQSSARTNIQQMEQRHMFEQEGGVPRGLRQEIEASFLAASRNSLLIKTLARKLHAYGLFNDYQDRFFALVRSAGKQ